VFLKSGQFQTITRENKNARGYAVSFLHVMVGCPEPQESVEVHGSLFYVLFE